MGRPKRPGRSDGIPRSTSSSHRSSSPSSPVPAAQHAATIFLCCTSKNMSTSTWKGEASSLEYSIIVGTLRSAASQPMSGSSRPTSVTTRTTRMRGSSTSSSILWTVPPDKTSLIAEQMPSIVFGSGYRSTRVFSDLLDIRLRFPLT